jgi:hypothetical protein
MPVPPPEPPKPGLSPPAGDIASELLPPVPGRPTFEPGWVEATIPAPVALPPAAFGGARTDPASPGPPRPEPFLPKPERLGPDPMEGGGAMTLPARSVPLPEPLEVPAPKPLALPEPVSDGGGGMTFDEPNVGF